MTVTTGMLMAGKMSTVMVTIAPTPRTEIKRAMTTNVYGRRSASLTIHILVCLWKRECHRKNTMAKSFSKNWQGRPGTAGAFRRLADSCSNRARHPDASRAFGIWKGYER